MPGWPDRRPLAGTVPFAAPPDATALDAPGVALGVACAAIPLLLWRSARRQPAPLGRLFRALAVAAAVAGPGSFVVSGAAAPLLGLWVAVLALGHYALTRPVEAVAPSPEPAPEPVPEAVPVPPAARPADDLYRLLFDRHPSPMWAFDEETLKFVAVNDAVVEAYGYSRDEFLTLGVRDVCPAEDADRLAADGQPDCPTWRHRTASGAVLSSEVIFGRLRIDGRPVRLVMGSEVTDRRRAEEALREREAFLRSLLANIPCGVFWKDRASIYAGCNDQFARDCGLAGPGEAIGQTDYELMPDPDEAERCRASDRRVMESGTALLNVEETRTRAGGAKVVLLTGRVPMWDAAGRVMGVLGVYQDITDRKRLEEQLRQAQKMEAIGRLAGGVAHDFNNLLTIIICNVHLLRGIPRPDPALPPLVDDIQAAAERASGLTRQLLSFSRKQPTRPEVIDLSDTVGGLAGLLRRLLGERVTVRTELAPRPVWVRADRGQLEQVVMNLAVNAKDAMPEGGTLALATSETTAPARSGGTGRFAVLSIADTGCGMTDEVKARIFEPFFTTKEIGKGTGLGLATVYGIAEQAGGAIEVESAPGMGTTFRIRLPLSEVAASASSTNIPAIGAGPAGRGRSVLLVEDEERIRKVARHTLEDHGYVVAEADRAEAAIELLRPDRRFDLLVTDLVMPGLDGRELASRVRALWPEVGVVFISGYVPDLRRIDDLPGALFLPKPFTPFDLARVVARAFGRTRAGRESRDGVAART